MTDQSTEAPTFTPRPAPADRLEGLARLREPFPPNQISLLPRNVRKGDQDRYACERSSQDFRRASKDGKECGGYHPWSIHLDYVGHAALTDRLLDADPEWTWEPVATDEAGAPLRDRDGGMWIRLTVQGVTRLGYGDAQGKTGPNATKELIGDALRNAAMRFGAALDLWHKGDLHEQAEERGVGSEPQGGAQTARDARTAPAAGANQARPIAQPAQVNDEAAALWLRQASELGTADELMELLKEAKSKGQLGLRLHLPNGREVPLGEYIRARGTRLRQEEADRAARARGEVNPDPLGDGALDEPTWAHSSEEPI